ncbi:MAG: cadherin-like beta sandwich domain-containing protein [Treponema sp.]|jgi:hypothetical protein|nr:cadherin-like beta sandwich domain-containing protein [Treponema sp.]
MKKHQTTNSAAALTIAALVVSALLLAACEQPAGKTLSEDAALKTLSVSAGSLTPAFSAAAADYTVTVANTVESITVTAEAASGKAAVSGGGTKSLAVGDNTITVTVTAESGAVKTYTITVRRVDASTKFILTAAELAKIGVDSAWPLAGTYVLDADITLADWTPVGRSIWKSAGTPLDPDSTPFTGSFDGNGRTITLQSFAAAPVAVDKAYLGIFGGVKGAENAKAVVKNLKIVSSVTVTSAPGTGQAAGLIAGYIYYGGIVAECYFTSNVTAQGITDGAAINDYAGGIAGFCAAGGGGDNTEGFAPANLKSCVALNPSVSAPNGFERVGRVIGDSTGGVSNTFGWTGMSVTVSGAAQTWDGSGAADGRQSVNGADCVEKPAQSLYEGLGWDFATVWKMGSDGYPHLIWE